MRLRTTAAGLLAALALVLPTAGQSLALGHDPHHDGLGTFFYRFTDGDGESRTGQIHPGDNDTCYQLTHAQRHPAYAVKNETDSLALVYRNGNCGGEAEETVFPGDRANNLNARSVYFKPVDGHHGRHDGDDWDDEDRSAGPRTVRDRAGDLFGRVIGPRG
ncbi:hypothetical protein ACFXPI_17595 [Streptomyces sp. NPDC059104]|uniref:hypothetical protein n=1 Tax=Streptomyces sp. NPDC059104 TaxID=3346729 RepID=UPI003691AF07